MLLRDGIDALEYELERTYRSLGQPTPDGGPYLSQEGDCCFFVDEVRADGTVYGWTIRRF